MRRFLVARNQSLRNRSDERDVLVFRNNQTTAVDLAGPNYTNQDGLALGTGACEASGPR